MIRVLVVEDSPVIQELIVQYINNDPQMEVIAVAVTGVEAVELAQKHKPDVITMDVNLPEMNGLDATKKIMETNPVPIIICSANFNPKDMDDTFSALSAGAAAIAEKPHSYGTKSFDVLIGRLLNNIRLLSAIKVYKRVPVRPITVSNLIKKSLTKEAYLFNNKFSLIAIGASTGGPVIIERLLAHLPERFSIPIIIVQHITPGFSNGFVEWLQKSSKINIKLAEQNEPIQPGNCYVAPDNCNCTVSKNMVIHLEDTPPEHSAKPSVSVLFRSVAKNVGDKALGILLTGMGRDGAAELKMIKDAGGETIIQDADSSVVYGMPGEALKLHAEKQVLTPEKMIEYFHEIS